MGLTAARASDLYPRYNDGCQNCHGAFTDGYSPKGTVFPRNSKHDMHRRSEYMGTDCNLCHLDGDNRNPYTYQSNGTANTPGLGCAGCHGRDYGGAVGVSGAGLRAHHAANGVTFCTGCHYDDPEPLPEDVPPPYYGSPDTNANDSCNSDPDYLENWSVGDTLGLDNDGDNLYDSADPDCTPVVPCAADLDGDGDTDDADLMTLLDSFAGSGVPSPGGDLDGDGDTDLDDLTMLLRDFGCVPA